MLGKSSTLMIIIAVFLVSFFCSPSTARALTVDDCPSIDAAIEQNAAKILQDQYNQAIKTVSLFNTLSTSSIACLKQLQTVLRTLTGLSDPIASIGKILLGQLANVIGQACSQVVGSIQGLESSAVQFLKICLPIPSFHFNLGLQGLTPPPCNGNIQIPLATLGPPPSSAAKNAVEPIFGR